MTELLLVLERTKNESEEKGEDTAVTQVPDNEELEDRETALEEEIATEKETDEGSIAPVKVRIDAATETMVVISWEDTYEGEEGFIIQRRDEKSDWKAVHITGPNETSWTDRTISPNTMYSYRVSVFNESMEMAWSEEAVVLIESKLKRETKENKMLIESLTSHLQIITNEETRNKSFAGCLNTGIGTILLTGGVLIAILIEDGKKDVGSEFHNLCNLMHIFSGITIIGGGVVLIDGIFAFNSLNEYIYVYNSFINMPESTEEEIKGKVENGEQYLKQLAEKGKKEKPWWQSNPSTAETEYQKYQKWKARQEEQTTLFQELRDIMEKLEAAQTIPRIFGFEGAGSKIIFKLTRLLFKNPVFRSNKRERKNPDPFNSLYNFGSCLLFTRCNALVRAMGLNPYLGFLHSKDDSYESLVCDIMEPFRFRVTRLIMRLVNRKEITENHFTRTESGWRLKNYAVKEFIQAFEGELLFTIKGDPGNCINLIKAQVLSIFNWIKNGSSIKIYTIEI
jgi:CRISPR-associated endonuclease Cas1